MTSVVSLRAQSKWLLVRSGKRTGVVEGPYLGP